MVHMKILWVIVQARNLAIPHFYITPCHSSPLIHCACPGRLFHDAMQAFVQPVLTSQPSGALLHEDSQKTILRKADTMMGFEDMVSEPQSLGFEKILCVHFQIRTASAKKQP